MHENITNYDSVISVDHWFESKIQIGTYTVLQDELISMSTYYSSMDEPTIGNCYSAELDCEILTINYTIPRMAVLYPSVRACGYINGTLTYSGWIPKGTFYLDTRERTKNGSIDTIKIHGYDAMLKAEQPCFTTIPASWSNVSYSYLLNLIANTMGVTVDSTSLATVQALTYTAPFPGIGEGAYTMREVLGMIASACASNWVMDDYGKLRLIPLKLSSTATSYLLAHTGKPLTFGGTRILIS